MKQSLHRLAMEPPFRMLAKACFKLWPVSIETRALWGISHRPGYLQGVLTAAEQAAEQGVAEIAAIEFGVGGGDGLVVLQREAAAVEKALGVRIKVYGFDTGTGHPPPTGDHRDHPDVYCEGDFPMDEASVRARLDARTTLVLGDVRETVPRFRAEHAPPPIGFIAFDLNTYASTRAAMEIFGLPLLWHVPLFFGSVTFVSDHRFAGEFLAIDAFNAASEAVKIDRWPAVRVGRPYPNDIYLEGLYVAHDLAQLDGVELDRPPKVR